MRHIAIRCLAGLLFSSLFVAARADSFNISYSFGAITASGIINATGTPGDYTAVSGSIVRDGETFTLSAPGSLPSPFGSNDNLLFFPNTPYLDGSGLSFSGAGTDALNISYDGTEYVELALIGEIRKTHTFEELTVSPVPEIPTSLLLVTILAMVGLGLRGSVFARGHGAGAGAARG